MNLDGFDRIRLVGDEDTGVGLECLDCWDGGRPLAYLRPYGDPYEYPDAGVRTVDAITDLLMVGRAHLDKHAPGERAVPADIRARRSAETGER